ncbi:hypothetical protein D3C80_1791900 [compost metagenome]
MQALHCLPGQLVVDVGTQGHGAVGDGLHLAKGLVERTDQPVEILRVVAQPQRHAPACEHSLAPVGVIAHGSAAGEALGLEALGGVEHGRHRLGWASLWLQPD